MLPRHRWRPSEALSCILRDPPRCMMHPGQKNRTNSSSIGGFSPFPFAADSPESARLRSAPSIIDDFDHLESSTVSLRISGALYCIIWITVVRLRRRPPPAAAVGARRSFLRWLFLGGACSRRLPIASWFACNHPHHLNRSQSSTPVITGGEVKPSQHVDQSMPMWHLTCPWPHQSVASASSSLG
jgi:hypothetical protein